MNIIEIKVNLLRDMHTYMKKKTAPEDFATWISATTGKANPTREDYLEIISSNYRWKIACSLFGYLTIEKEKESE